MPDPHARNRHAHVEIHTETQSRHTHKEPSCARRPYHHHQRGWRGRERSPELILCNLSLSLIHTNAECAYLVFLRTVVREMPRLPTSFARQRTNFTRVFLLFRTLSLQSVFLITLIGGMVRALAPLANFFKKKASVIDLAVSVGRVASSLHATKGRERIATCHVFLCDTCDVSLILLQRVNAITKQQKFRLRRLCKQQSQCQPRTGGLGVMTFCLSFFIGNLSAQTLGRGLQSKTSTRTINC